MTIYNRSGQEVFQSDDLNRHWDGTKNGNPQPSGTYYWIATMQCIRDNTIIDKQYKGWVTLLR